MIIVNCNRSYPGAARAAATGNLTPLTEVVNGDWYAISDSTVDEYGDLLIATADNRVVDIRDIVGSSTVLVDDRERRRFDTVPAKRYHRVIGEPMPGGPWKRGEAIGSRRVHTDQEWLDMHEHAGATLKDYTRAVIEQATATVTPPQDEPLVDGLPAGMQITVGKTGVVTIKTPTGTKIVIETT